MNVWRWTDRQGQPLDRPTGARRRLKPSLHCERVFMRLVRLLACALPLLAFSPPASFAQPTAKPADPAQSASAPPVLFPVEARFAFLDFQRVTSDSVSGKLAARILQELRTKKLTEIETRNKELQTLASRRDSGVLSGPALVQVRKDIANLQRELP